MAVATLRVDDDAIRVVEREHAVASHIFEIEHDAGRAVRVTAESDVPDDVGVVAERRIHERRHGPRALEIEKQPSRPFDALLIERQLRDRAPP